MPKARTPRATKAKSEKKVLQMPESPNGETNHSTNGELESAIRLRAYQLYEQRGYTDGAAERDWFEAEREVLARCGNREHTA
ncbi:MAG: DUF2934 domain-containing protein [Acidobacteria bacterium]|nr:DUF2934 domain-containing protein [Acidobacteriota bacterium]MBV9624095.1 DUF2934 domain-containing protein [Acidobacteriota bacterium]